ncbi:hypothetical protein ACFQX6_66460 [Streptosporangium lutulentum]
MTDDQIAAQTTMNHPNAEEAENLPDTLSPGPVCARATCANQLKPRPMDAEGRRQGGRQAKYCSDACRAAAYKERTATYTTAVGAATDRATALSEQLLPRGEQWLTGLNALTEQLRLTNQGLAEQTRAAEEAAEEARASAATEAQHAETANRERDTARAQALETRKQATETTSRAERDRDQAQEGERAAWAKVATLEAARARDEQATSDATRRAKEAEAARDTLAGELSRLEEAWNADRKRVTEHDRQQKKQIDDLQEQLASRDTALAEQAQQLQEATDLAQQAVTDRDQSQATATTVQDQLTQLTEKLRTEREQAKAAARVAKSQQQTLRWAEKTVMKTEKALEAANATIAALRAQLTAAPRPTS